MFKKLQMKLAERRAHAELSKNPIVEMGRKAIGTYWLDKPHLKQQHSKEYLDNVAGQLMERVVQIATAQDPVAANRKELVGMTSAAADYDVLILDPPPTEDETGIRGILGISGELRAHLEELVTINKYLADEFHGIPKYGSPDQYYDVCVIRYRQCYAAMHVHHELRFELDDYNPNAALDWFPPLFLVQCAISENHYRGELGLPTVLEPMEALEYSTLINYVTNGEKWPDLAWERHYGKKLPRIAKPKVG